MSEDQQYAGPTKQSLIDEVRAMHNDICISMVHDDLCRVVGIHFDYRDVYFITRRPGHGDAETPLSYETMVCACESLKGVAKTHDYLERSFARNNCPPSDEFIVSADRREACGEDSAYGWQEEEREKALAEGHAYYDKEMVPMLAANAHGIAPLSPWQTRQAANREAVEAFVAAYPAYADTIARLHWDGVIDGVDTYRNFSGGRIAATFDRASGTVQGMSYDRESGEDKGPSTDIDEVMWAYVPASRHRKAA